MTKLCVKDCVACDKVVCERLSVAKLHQVVCERVVYDKVVCERIVYDKVVCDKAVCERLCV